MKNFAYFVMTEDGDEIEEFSTLKNATVFAKEWSRENQDKCYVCVMGEMYFDCGKEVEYF